MVVHASKLTCSVRVNLDRSKDVQAIEGLCTIVAHEARILVMATGNARELRKSARAISRLRAVVGDSLVCQEPHHSRPVLCLRFRKEKPGKPSDMRSGRT